MDHKSYSTADNDGQPGQSSSSASSDGVAVAEHQLGTVPAGPGECAEVEKADLDARQSEQV